MTQEAIPVDDTIEPPRICGWCNDPAVDEIILEPERYSLIKRKGQMVRVPKKRAITAGVCRDHRDILDKQPKGDKPDTYKIK